MFFWDFTFLIKRTGISQLLRSFILKVVFILIKRNRMNESDKFLQLQNILAENVALKNLLGLIKGIASKHDDFCCEAFTSSHHLKFLVEEMNKLRIPELNQILYQLKEPNSIIALPIKMQPKFTLFFVLVPQGQKFDWHSHPKMTGISKCIHGLLDISTIDYHYLRQINSSDYAYPKEKLRYQRLHWQSMSTVSTIDPHALNIHKIEARQFSAFFDLLMPDYPENTCQFFTTKGEDSYHLLMEQITSPREEIKGWDVALQEMYEHEKHIVKTFILQ